MVLIKFNFILNNITDAADLYISLFCLSGSDVDEITAVLHFALIYIAEDRDEPAQS